jgi:hypothetical protein
MTAPMARASIYGIEASGWDANEEFFVEMSDLQGTPGRGQRLTLRHALRVGAIVFLRLVHATALGPAFPVAYQVRMVRRSDFAGTWELDLAELRHRDMRPQKEEALLTPQRNEDLAEQPR